MIQETAIISEKATIGKDTRIWHFVQVREDSIIGSNCNIGKNVYVDFGVKIGNNVKIQNNASIFHGVTIEDGVFIGPHVCLTNDKNPRAINTDGSLKKDSDWEVTEIKVRKGASVGASSVVLPGVEIGEFAMIGAGSVVVKDIPAYCLAYGNPAEIRGYVCKCGIKVEDYIEKDGKIMLKCSKCNTDITIKKE